ncbi:MAG: TetR/AcrR family transcriptional regulator [Defluviitaleaceae bacterium]|nr:TetR/AcrR family transcriptional regulator [Defluviitaleaceae bacterium]MCL2276010.1 TetR/AcrR family transcriptional regulator [Defluviitaleaceae bacterium]
MPRNKHPEETIKKILETSLQLFAEKGYEQTTVLDIVANLGGLTRGAFYHHFKSKEEVLQAILDSDYNVRNPFETAMNTPFPNGLERLKYALKLGLKLNIDSEQRKQVTSVAMTLLANPRFLSEHIKNITIDAKSMTTLLEDGMADGSIKKGNAMALAELFLLLTNVWMMPNIFPASEADTKEKANIIMGIFKGMGYDFIDEELENIFFGLLNQLHPQI